ncbi:MAG: hypothetical protein ACI80L_000094 [Pseudohongiellaceae bacterium]|jgi:hypothetical protein
MTFSVYRAPKAGVKVSFHLAWRTRLPLTGNDCTSLCNFFEMILAELIRLEDNRY